MISMIEMAGVLSIALVGAAGAAHLLQRLIPCLDEARSGARGPARWGDTEGPFRYVRRPQRFQVCCTVCYGTEQAAGRGCVTDMSRSGWRVQGKTSVPVGGRLTLQVALPGAQNPVRISEAVVRWVGPEEFGISLLAVDPDAAGQLSDYFRWLEAPLAAGMHAP